MVIISILLTQIRYKCELNSLN